MNATRRSIATSARAAYLGAGGHLVTGKQFPARWLDRLDVAIEKGAIDHLSIDRIVDIMLQGPR